MQTAWEAASAEIALAVFALFFAIALAWSARRREATPLVLAAFIAAGGVRMAFVVAERGEAVDLLARIDPSAPRLIAGRVEQADDDARFHRTRITLSHVTITSGPLVLRLPGLLSASVASSGPFYGGESSEDTTHSLNRAASGSTDARNDASGPSAVIKTSGSFALEALTPGQRVRMIGTVSEPVSYWNFHLRDTRDLLAQKGVYAAARIRSPSLVSPGEEASGLFAGIERWLVRVRRSTSDGFLRYMPRREAQLMDYLFFNDASRLTDDDSFVLRASGTMQLFAVSGTHIALLAGLLFILLRAGRVPARAAWTSACALLLPYIWLLDFNPPATRAWLALAALTAGRWLKREVDPISALAFAVALILLLDPGALWHLGFQLSLGGVFAIVVLVPLGRQWIRDAPAARAIADSQTSRAAVVRFLADALIVSIAVPLFILPLQLRYMQNFNLLSPAANALLAFLAGPLLASGLALAALADLLPLLATVFGAAATCLMACCRTIAEFTADQTWATVHVPQTPSAIVVLYLAIIISGYYFVRRDTPEFVPKSMARFAIHSALGIALLAGTAIVQRHVIWPGGPLLRVWFFDVGQGDSALVQFPSGRTLLVDAGNMTPDFGRLVVVPELSALGVWPLDDVLATHADADHVGGIPYVLQHYPVHRLVEGTDHPPDAELMKLIDQAAAEAAAQRLQVTTTEKRRDILNSVNAASAHGDAACTLEVLNPDAGAAHPAENNNDQSVVLRLRYGQFAMLLMGDASVAVERRLCSSGIGACDVLKVGHHGSRSSSCAEFLASVRPTAAVISCGRRNRYGHPNAEVLASLRAVGSQIYRTDRNGAVLVETDGKSFQITTVRDAEK